MSDENKSDIIKACFFQGPPLSKKKNSPNIFVLVQSGPCCVKDSIMSGTQLREKKYCHSRIPCIRRHGPHRPWGWGQTLSVSILKIASAKFFYIFLLRCLDIFEFYPPPPRGFNDKDVSTLQCQYRLAASLAVLIIKKKMSTILWECHFKIWILHRSIKQVVAMYWAIGLCGFFSNF